MRPLTRKRKAPALSEARVEPVLSGEAVAPAQLSLDFRAEAPRRGPGPSKLAYRLTRSWKKIWVRRVALVVLPIALASAVTWRAATDPAVIAAAFDARAALIDMMSQRPEFAVKGVRVRGASEPLAKRVETALALPGNASSLNTDVVALQARLLEIPAVRDVRVQLKSDGMLDVLVDERIAEALWRDEEGSLWLVDHEGVELAAIGERRDRAELPLILGRGAPDKMAEALSVYRAAPDLRPRLRALVRIGERRWNVALDRGLTILLPESDPEEALERVMAWHFGEELLDRSLVSVDMRLPGRPTLRMSPEAAETYRIDLERANAEGEDT